MRWPSCTACGSEVQAESEVFAALAAEQETLSAEKLLLLGQGEELEPEPEARRKVLHCDAGFVVVAIGWPQPACAEITGDLVSRRG